ncbi:MAG: hypothetical protein GY858_05765 [Candidatus Omnitrophica bacterium]|nr:hypothetical protein [Candidatus Omnitrophota bacterium]
MILQLQRRRASISFRAVAIIVTTVFLFSVFSLYLSKSHRVYASALPYMSAPAKLVSTSSTFNPPLLRGIKLHADNPFKIDFIVDQGDFSRSSSELEEETKRLIKYFLASITIPEEDLWVNLSPYEKDRMVPNALGLTDMGRDLLGEDYVLKQLTASLTYPDSPLGKKFWDKVYERTEQLYGTTNIPANTFSKIWIMPQKAVVYEDRSGAFVAESHLKVMMEADYFAAQKNQQTIDHRLQTTDHRPETRGRKPDTVTDVSAAIMKDVILPVIEEEINTGAQFAHLRQIYHSLILATWFKKKLKQTALEKAYIGKNKIKGADTSDPQIKEKIYNQYLEAYTKGAYNYIRRDLDVKTNRRVSRRYYSGGFTTAGEMDEAFDARPLERLPAGQSPSDFDNGPSTLFQTDLSALLGDGEEVNMSRHFRTSAQAETVTTGLMNALESKGIVFSPKQWQGYGHADAYTRNMIGRIVTVVGEVIDNDSSDPISLSAQDMAFQRENGRDPIQLHLTKEDKGNTTTFSITFVSQSNQGIVDIALDNGGQIVETDHRPIASNRMARFKTWDPKAAQMLDSLQRLEPTANLLAIITNGRLLDWVQLLWKGAVPSLDELKNYTLGDVADHLSWPSSLTEGIDELISSMKAATLIEYEEMDENGEMVKVTKEWRDPTNSLANRLKKAQKRKDAIDKEFAPAIKRLEARRKTIAASDEGEEDKKKAIAEVDKATAIEKNKAEARKRRIDISLARAISKYSAARLYPGREPRLFLPTPKYTLGEIQDYLSALLNEPDGISTKVAQETSAREKRLELSGKAAEILVNVLSNEGVEFQPKRESSELAPTPLEHDVYIKGIISQITAMLNRVKETDRLTQSDLLYQEINSNSVINLNVERAPSEQGTVLSVAWHRTSSSPAITDNAQGVINLTISNEGEITTSLGIIKNGKGGLPARTFSPESPKGPTPADRPSLLPGGFNSPPVVAGNKPSDDTTITISQDPHEKSGDLAEVLIDALKSKGIAFQLKRGANAVNSGDYAAKMNNAVSEMFRWAIATGSGELFPEDMLFQGNHGEDVINLAANRSVNPQEKITVRWYRRGDPSVTDDQGRVDIVISEEGRVSIFHQLIKPLDRNALDGAPLVGGGARTWGDVLDSPVSEDNVPFTERNGATIRVKKKKSQVAKKEIKGKGKGKDSYVGGIDLDTDNWDVQVKGGGAEVSSFTDLPFDVKNLRGFTLEICDRSSVNSDELFAVR